MEKPLTEQHITLLYHVSQGLSDKEIGKKMSMSEDGIGSALRAARQRIGAVNRAHFVALGFMYGYLKVPRQRQMIQQKFGDALEGIAQSGKRS